MAATGFTPISIFYSTTASAVPLAANLVAGELAMNTNDGKLFFKDSSGVVQTMASKGTGSIGGSTTQVQFNNAGVLGGSASLTWNGTVLTSSGFAGPLNGTVGATTRNTGAFTSLDYNTTLTGGTGIVNLGSGQFYKDASGNVGIGTSSPLLTASGRGNITINGSSSSILVLANGGATSGYVFGDASSLGFSAGSGANSRVMTFDTNGTTRLTLDASGNLGLGVTPSAWLTVNAMQLGSYGQGIAGGTGQAGMYVGSNNYYGSGGWTYTTTAYATQYKQNESNSGSHAWMVAPSGTAGNAITFTQAMTLDASGNLGVGTTSPGAKLDVRGNGYFINATSPTSFWSADSGLSTGSGYCQWNTSANEFRVESYTNHPLVFGTNNTERMRIDSSGNVGIGTASPSTWGTKLVVYNGQLTTTNSGYDGTYADSIYFGGNSEGTTYRNKISNSLSSTVTNQLMKFSVANGASTWVDALILNGAGNAGLGVTPSVWRTNSGEKAIQIGGNYPATLHADGGGYFDIGSNYYINSSGNFIYTASGSATRYYMAGGGATSAHVWQVSSSGTAGNTISFTSAMTLDANSNLLVGTTSNAINNSNSVVLVSNNGTVVGQIICNHLNGTGSGERFASFGYNGTSIGSITQNGTTGVLYNITSDYRLKTVIGAVSGHGERIDALEPVEYEWKSDGSRARGFLAHKFQEVYANSVAGEKDAVDAEGNPVHQTMQASTAEVIADLVAEIQDLRKRLAALEAK